MKPRLCIGNIADPHLNLLFVAQASMLAICAGFNSFWRETAHTLAGAGIAVHQMSAGRIKRPHLPYRALAAYLLESQGAACVKSWSETAVPLGTRIATTPWFSAWWHELHPSVRSA